MIVTVEQVLKHAERFEEMLAEHYTDLAEQTQREGVRLLARHMSGRHRVMAEALKDLPPEWVHRLRRVLLPFGPEAVDCRCCKAMDLPPEATAAQVLDAAIGLDDCLLRFYRQVSDQPVPPEVEDLFDGLCLFEEGDEVMLKKIKAMD